MSAGLKLVVHFGESDRAGDRLLSDALVDLLAARGVLASALLRGVEGFGIDHRLRTDRLLSLSEDLPLVVVAVDVAERIRRLADEVAALVVRGLVTLERVALPGLLRDDPAPDPGDAHAKLTIYHGRGERVGGRPLGAALVGALRDAGVPGAIVLTGLDGTLGGERRRARFLSRNAGVPALAIAVAPRPVLAGLLPRLRGLVGAEHVVTVERAHVVRRDGRALGAPPAIAARDAGGRAVWQRVTVVAGERERWEGRPLHAQLIRRLREHGAAGATVLRGVGGFSGEGPLHGDRLLAVRRHSPMALTMIDAVAEVARLWPVVARATAARGLVTCETVPAFRAGGSSGGVGGLVLADPADPV